MKKMRIKSCAKHYSTSCKNKRKDGVRKPVLDSLTNKTFVSTYSNMVDLTAQFETKLELSSLLSKQKNTRYDRIIADETEEQVESSSSNTLHNITSAQFPSTSKISSHQETKSLEYYNATNLVKEKKNNNRNIQMSNIDKLMTQIDNYLVTNLVGIKYIVNTIFFIILSIYY